MNTSNNIAKNAVSFNFEGKMQVRTIARNEEVWFLANDVCQVLGYKNPRMSVERHCRVRGVTKRDTPTESGIQSMVYINEPNLYRLVIKSRKPEAERFEQWVMEEVLPSIRKTGTYTMPDRLTPAQQRALQEAVSRRAGELPSEKRGMAFPKLWGGIKSHFQVGTYKDLSPAQYDAALSYIDSYEWEVLDKEMSIPALGNSFIPEQQANEIKIRLNRVGKIFHPFSDQFIDLNGVNRLLMGLDPNLGTAEKGYVKLIEKW